MMAYKAVTPQCLGSVVHVLVVGMDLEMLIYEAMKFRVRFRCSCSGYSCGLSTAAIEYSSPSVCLCVCLSVCVHDNSKNNGSIDLKL